MVAVPLLYEYAIVLLRREIRGIFKRLLFYVTKGLLPTEIAVYFFPFNSFDVQNSFLGFFQNKVIAVHMIVVGLLC